MKYMAFDLDGTLLDSAPDLHDAINATARQFGKPELDLTRVKDFIGNGVPRLVERAMQALDADLSGHEDWLAVFSSHYDANPARFTKPYPEVLTTLLNLRSLGWSLGVCTNKPTVPARNLLRHFNMLELIDCLIGGDSLDRRKPDPMPLIECFGQLGAKAEATCIFVGDSEVDAQCAEAAKIPFWLFKGGYRKSPVDQIRHDESFSGFGRVVTLAGQCAT